MSAPARLKRTVSYGALMLAVLAAPGTAQTSGSFGTGGYFESYTFGDPAQAGVQSISLMTVPFSARTSIGNRANLNVLGAFAKGKLTAPDGSEFDLSGLTDTHVLLNVTLVNGVALTGIFSAPTGQSTHDANEAVVAGAVAADLLPFRVTNWGSGGGVGMQLTGTRRFSGFGAGLSVAFRQATEFEPSATTTAQYQPGNEIRARLALDTEMGSGGKGTLVIGVQQYAEDQVDGTNLFQSGNRVEVIGTYAFPLGFRASGAFYGGVLHRANGQFFGGPVADAPSQDLLLAGGVLRRTIGRNVLAPRFDFRAFRSADGLGQGYVGSVGMGLEIRSGNNVFIPTVTGRMGNVEARSGQESGITGFEAGMTVRFGR